MLVDFVHSSSGADGPGARDRRAARRAAGDAGPAPAAEPELAEDDEMREVFLEEAREVIADARAAMAGWPTHRPTWRR